ncbi:hypothetical protein GQ602_006643 [Ophiocordyceps camponoti-floridani]|uniref:Uncharacterized protein n=1 Tax=Ophiocordyceps camponoti-floridani TaxID=2030778 RepID=A0A8H4Q1M9_9HYPO|nr:hypothetical protein GQ602_006643 [Ophiocordyceps camponoti-floridani]
MLVLGAGKGISRLRADTRCSQLESHVTSPQRHHCWLCCRERQLAQAPITISHRPTLVLTGHGPRRDEIEDQQPAGTGQLFLGVSRVPPLQRAPVFGLHARVAAAAADLDVTDGVGVPHPQRATGAESIFCAAKWHKL